MNRQHVWTGFGFRRVQWTNAAVVVVPEWFVLFSIALVCSAPWLPLRRRFSLRTMLVATTLVGLGLSALLWLR